MSSLAQKIRGVFAPLASKIRGVGERLGAKIRTVKKKIFGRKTVPSSVKAWARFAKDVYSKPSERTNVNNYVYKPEYSNLTEGTYVDPESKKIVISMRGTDFSSVTDLLDDIKIITGREKFIRRVPENVDLIKRIRRDFPQHIITLVGHSLGSTVALNTLSALSEALPAHIFNVGFAKIQIKPDKSWKRVTSHRISGDIISILSRTVPQLNTKVYEKQTSEPHGIANFL